MQLLNGVKKSLEKGRDDPNMPTILLIAYTGVAANNIGGTSFHTGLGFKFGSDMLDFTPQKLD